MKRFKNVLFVADPDADNAPALTEALSLCRRHGAALTLTLIVPDTVIGITAMVQEAMLEHGAEWLDELTRGADVGQVPIRTTLHCGRPFIEVIREVLDAGHDLVIKPAEPVSGLGGQMFAATDKKLLRKCPCPVWLIKPGEQRGPREVLVALDFDSANPENAPLNQELLDLAMSMCVAEFAELHIVHAWQLEHEGF
ncbi:MAG: universal stress protein, partial [Pseudomonadota bacterium]